MTVQANKVHEYLENLIHNDTTTPISAWNRAFLTSMLCTCVLFERNKEDDLEVYLIFLVLVAFDGHFQ